jgi:hypothetical protein
MLSYVDHSDSGTFEWGTYYGVLVAYDESRLELWFDESSEGGDDICL